MKDQRRKHILDTAMKLFNENGFHATPTSKIAKKAKISVGTLFNYFPTKEVLIQEIYMEIKNHSSHEFLDHIESMTTSHDTIQSMWRAVIFWGIENPEEFKYLELYSHSPFKNLYKEDKVMDTYMKFRESILKQLSPTPNEFCLNYPEYFMSFIDNSTHAAIRFILTNELDNVDRFINSSFDLIWKGLT